MAALIVKDGPLAGRRFEVTGDLVIGRDAPGVTIEDAEVSARHAVARDMSGAIEIEDLGSLNGTWVNGSRIERATQLSNGDVVKVGRTSIEVTGIVVQAAATVASAPAPAANAPMRAEAVGSVEPPAQPFGTYASVATKASRRRVQTRLLSAELATFVSVLTTAAILLAYFIGRR
jgi:pSer/pThr/pTyr-binding forkhead associated (FHA) protein